jgi:hypothetical protein
LKISPEPADLSATGELLNLFALLSGTAVISSNDGTFELAQTCPATGGRPRPGLPDTGPGQAGTTPGRLAAVGGALLMAGVQLLVVLHRRRRNEVPRAC